MAMPDELIIGTSINNLTGITGYSYQARDMIRAAVEAEAMGFDAVWVHDAPLGRRTVAAYDDVTVLSAIATRTRRIRLCTGILQPHLRNPVSLAIQWATLFTLSEGRALLGVGAGGSKSGLVKREFQALAALRHDTALDPDRIYEKRMKLFEESVEIMRRLWAEDKVSYRGEFYRFDGVTLGQARPYQPPPVLMAVGIYFPEGASPHIGHFWREKKAGRFVLGKYRLVVDLGDGWLTCNATPEEVVAGWSKIDEYARQQTPQKRYLRAFNCFVNVSDDRRKGWEGVKAQLAGFHGPPVPDDLVDRWAVAGPPEEVARRLQEYVDAGVRIFQLVIGSPDQFGQMKSLAEKVLPLLKRRA